jgi:hypothetical protein
MELNSAAQETATPEAVTLTMEVHQQAANVDPYLLATKLVLERSLVNVVRSADIAVAVMITAAPLIVTQGLV